MRYRCSRSTDLMELFGREESTVDGFRFRCGPIAQAMKNGEELVLENSAALSQIMLVKIRELIRSFFIVETEERIYPTKGFHLIMG